MCACVWYALCVCARNWCSIFYLNAGFSTFTLHVARVSWNDFIRKSTHLYNHQQHKHESNFMAETLHHISFMAHILKRTTEFNSQTKLQNPVSYKVFFFTHFKWTELNHRRTQYRFLSIITTAPLHQLWWTKIPQFCNVLSITCAICDKSNETNLKGVQKTLYGAATISRRKKTITNVCFCIRFWLLLVIYLICYKVNNQFNFVNRCCTLTRNTLSLFLLHFKYSSGSIHCGWVWTTVGR